MKDADGMNTIVIYVDDLLILASKQEMKKLKKVLMQCFEGITMEVQYAVSYLGMQINRWDNQFEIEMYHYLEKLLQPYAELPMRCTPGIRTVYQVNESAEKLKENERKMFHTETAKLLFLAKRVRPDKLTVVSFLCTQVTHATVQDRKN